MNIEILKEAFGALANEDSTEEKIVASFIFDDVAPQGVCDSTLKLYGMSCG